MEEQKSAVVNIDGVEYSVDSLTPEVLAKVNLYQKWAFQLNELRQEYAKTDFAVRAIAAEITAAVKAPQSAAAEGVVSDEPKKSSKKKQ